MSSNGCGRRGLPLALGLAVACWVGSFTRLARADEARAPLHWYGWQTLTTDGAGVSLLIASSVPEQHHQYRLAGAQVDAGLATLVLGAPIVHAVHARWGAALGSLALRTGLPALAYFALSEPCSGECSGQLLLGLLAVTAPMALDAAALSWERVPAASEPPQSARLKPYASAGRHQLSLGIRASF